MLFKEIRNLIKADNAKDSRYIREFNIENRSSHSFFLLVDAWDKFAAWMCKNYPEFLMTLEYPPLEEDT